MKIGDLSSEVLEKVKAVRYDRIVEKHEGPFDWKSVLKYEEPEFLVVDGRAVLLPVEKARNANITILRTIWSADGRSLTLFLKDTTFGGEWFECGFLTVCDKMPGEEFFLAVVYHEWFVMDPPGLAV
jgi:hypothetical protein